MTDLRIADLHTHTCCSDGLLSPAELVEYARSHDLHALAITDHDCVDGLKEGMAAGQACGVEVIAGVELSVTVGEDEVHLLGYFFDPDHPALNEHLRMFQQARTKRVWDMVERLHDLGVAVPFEAVQEQAKGQAIGRPHVAQALVDGGMVATYRDAFDLYLSNRAPAFVSKPLFPARDALDLLHEAGGIGVIAHPGHWMHDTTLMTLIRHGLDGIETIHPAHDTTLTRYYRQIARDFGLLETGGSDYHGTFEGLDEVMGHYHIPYPQVEKARRVSEQFAIT